MCVPVSVLFASIELNIGSSVVTTEKFPFNSDTDEEDECTDGEDDDYGEE